MGDIGLNIAVSGLLAQQAAMDVIAENLANTNTPGYVSETADLVTTPGSDPLGIGDGVTTAAVTQASDGLLQTNLLQAQGAQSLSASLEQALSGVQAAFPEPSETGLAEQLSSFWQAWDGIVQDPSALAPRTAVVDLAQNLASSLQQGAEQLQELQTNSQSQLGNVVDQTNTLLSQVAQLNTQIVAVEGSGAPANSLIDQRNNLMNELSGDIGAVGRVMPDDTMTVTVGGVTLVQGSFADTLSVTGSPGSMVIQTQTSDATVPPAGGTAAGLLAAINQYLPQYQQQLDTTANDLETTVNTQLAAGYTATGASGSTEPLFTGTGAAGISVNSAIVNNPQLIAASSTATLPDATNDGGNAQAMAELGTSPTGPDQAYRTFIESMGAQLQNVQNQVQSQTSVVNAAQQNLQAVAGVDPDQQMVSMLNYQQVYEASAKVISTISTMVDSLMAAT
ncbi:MAG TPA: flagellar hook-associated protein FlgK [Acidimicrobiales bacterium]|nr:flagellar hook-associated protein FlgK [Acidimicrobiales bacterium]